MGQSDQISVLLVEDDEAARTTIAAILTAAGMTVEQHRGVCYPHHTKCRFWKNATFGELFSKMEFSIDFGFSVCFRYILVVIGKIEKSSLRHLERREREFSFFFVTDFAGIR